MRHLVNTGFSRLFLSLLSIFSSLTLAAKTINVPAQQPTIQDGINAAASGDTVLVAPGTYFENINFNGKAITVTSSGGPAVTIIDGSSVFGPAVTFSNGETSKSVVSGFTLQNGFQSEVSIVGASPTVKGNIILGGQTGFFSNGIAIQSGSALIRDNLVANTSSGVTGTSDTGIEIVGNVFAENQIGINLQYSTKPDLIQQNTIVDNTSGGFSSMYAVNTTLVQNLISGNLGTGVYWYQASNPPALLELISNTIAANTATQCCGTYGSEIDAFPIDGLTAQNNLIVATGNSSAFFCTSTAGPTTFTNNDVFSAGNSAYTSGCPDQTGTAGNLSVDPLFADTLSNNFHIQATSPVIKAGTTSAVKEPSQDFDGDPRIVDGAIDIGADEYSSTSIQTVSSYVLHFGDQDVSTSSAPQVVTLSNNGKSAVTINLIATGPNFSQTNNCGKSLAPANSCQISITFSPLSGGTINGVLGIFTNATLNPEAITLIGTGLAPQLQVGCCFDFFNQVIFTTNTQTVSVTNIGQAPLLISSIVYSGPTDFVESNNCPIAPNSLVTGASCTLTVSYTPTIVGFEGGSITITSNAGPPQVLSFEGSSVSAGNPMLAPTSLTFPTTLIGQSSSPETMTLTNAGTGPLGISSIFAQGDFQETNNCPTSLLVNASCTITVTYVPSVQGQDIGFLYIFNDSSQSSLSAQLNGIGEAPVPTIASLSLSALPVGTINTQVTITGTGFTYFSQVLWNGVAITEFSSNFGSTQITFTVPAASAGTYQVSVFTPSPGGGTSSSLPFTVYTPINYAEKSTTYTYRSITGTNLNLFYFNSGQIASPFPIQFGGGSYSNLTVGAGGTISFNGFSSESNDVIPTTQTSMLVAPFWAQLFPFGSNTNNNDVFWEVTGTAPNRELVVEWRNVGICCETTNTIRFEVVFFEGSSNILFNYADTIFGGAYSSNDNGATATSGVQVAAGLGTQFSYDQPMILSKTSLLWYPNNPTATLSTSALSFGYHQIDTPSLPQTLTLTNGGQVPLSISSVTTDNPDFVPTSGCGTTVAPGKTCVIRVVYTPSQPTAETATLTVTDNATNSPQTVSLTGIGSITPVVVYPILVNFGSVAVGSSGTAPVTLANASNAILSIQQIAADPSIFTQTNNCGTSLAPGLSCTVTVKFTPTQKGSIQGALAMGLNGKPTKIVSKLTGSGN